MNETRSLRIRPLIWGAGIAIAGLALSVYPGLPAAVLEPISGKVTAERLSKIGYEIFLVLPAAALVELMVVGWRRCSIRRLLFRNSASSKTDLILYLIQELRLVKVLTLPLGFLVTTGVAVMGNGVLARHFGIEDYTTVTNPILGFVVYFVLGDFVFYWVHRAQHGRLLWPVHRMHHSAWHMTLLNVSRHNVFADIVFGVVRAIPLSFILVPDHSIVAAQLMAALHGYLHHSNILSDWGWFGRWVLVSPLHHRLHHSSLPEDFDRNLAILPVMDRLFGTYKQPTCDDFPIGLPDRGYQSVPGSMRMLVLECVESLGLIRAWLAASWERVATPVSARADLGPAPPGRVPPAE